MKKVLFIFSILAFFLSCEKADNHKKCWDCYYLDNLSGQQVLPHKVFCDLTVEQLDTVRFDQGNNNSVSRKCFNMEFTYVRPQK
jgi:hypothetical protein